MPVTGSSILRNSLEVKYVSLSRLTCSSLCQAGKPDVLFGLLFRDSSIEESFMSAVRSLCFLFQCLLCFALLAFPAVALAQDNASPAIGVDAGRIDVTLTAAPNRSGMNASVRISYQLRNGTDKTDKAQRTFPVVAPAYRLLNEKESPWCRVLVDGIQDDADRRNFLMVKSAAT